MASSTRNLSTNVVVVIVLLLCISSAAFGDSGLATFYTPPYTPSACNGFQNDGVMIAAASDAFWNNGGACGKKFQITCVGGTNAVPHPCNDNGPVTVKIVDFCPPGCRGTIDLSQEAFAAIANPDAGVVRITYDEV